MTNTKRRARAIADVSVGTIFADVEIAAPPERVFAALTSPEEVPRWWGSDDSYRTTEWKMELRAGAPWKGSGVGRDGTPFSVEGEIVEVDAPRKLVWTWRAAWDGGQTTTITYRLEPIEGGTRVVMRHEGFGVRADSCRNHGEGWERVLGWMTQHLAKELAPRRFFVVKLIPPRPDFPANITAAEGAAMQAHVGYWSAKAVEGKAVVFGPVADPKGTWGLGVIEAASEAEIGAMEKEDPAIAANLGFRYEVLPMAQAITR
jgi:uncharacterized protein YndB with AHSA1/START domain/uncharacterized protein YciI